MDVVLIANETENICMDYLCIQPYQWYLKFGLMRINFHWIWRLIYDIHQKNPLIHFTLDIEAVTLVKWALLNVQAFM